MTNIKTILDELENDVRLHQKELVPLLLVVVTPLELLWFTLKPAITGRGISEAEEFVKRTLLTRCVTDLTAAVFLAKHHHFIQSLTVARPIIESLNLVDLIHDDSKATKNWLQGNWKEISPSKVRSKLGIKEDGFYKYLSDIASHPMWGMTRGMVAAKQGPIRKTFYVNVGPFTSEPLSRDYLVFTFGSLLVLLADTILVASKYYIGEKQGKALNLSIQGSFNSFNKNFIVGKHIENHKIFMKKFKETENNLT